MVSTRAPRSTRSLVLGGPITTAPLNIRPDRRGYGLYPTPAVERKVHAAVEADPELAWLTYVEQITPVTAVPNFIRDIAAKFVATGKLSDRQAAAAKRVLRERAERAALRDREREEYADAIPVPLISGRIPLVLKIYFIRQEMDDWGTYRWRARCREVTCGYTVFVNLPADVARQAKVGDVVTLVAQIHPSKKDPTCGSAKRPTRVTLIPSA